MPQDGTKSVVYRSFFSCDDPKGVAECKTSRKSKAVSKKPEDKVDHQRKQKNLSVSFSDDEDRKDIVPKGPTDELHNPSSVQLMEVSRGAHKLNQVIDNWSKGLSFDSQSKDIAVDLLRGALDLQESLAMLRKLQEAPQYMVKVKKKHKENAAGGTLEGAGIERTTSDRFGIERTTSDRFGIERTTSDRFGYQNNKMEFQKPRLSADGSSRDCYEELREVIRESFARQNLLPKSSAEENVYFDRRKSYSEEKAFPDRTKCYSEEKAYFESRKLDLSLDFPSTSSSQSSICHSNEFDSFDSALSKSQEEKTKGPNVIAKLMGLEEIPTKPWQSTMQKEKDKQQNRPIFDIDLPKARKPHCTFQKVDPQRRTLEELIEAVQFRGLVSNKSIDGSEHHKHLSNVSDWEKGLANDAPPIVIMKPLHLSVSFEEELQKQKHMREDMYRKEIIRKWNMEKAVPPKKISDCKGALNFSEIQRKLQAEMSPSKRLSKDKGEKDLGDVLKKSDDRVIKVQENQSSTKIKASAPVKPKGQKKEVMENKVNKIQRTGPNTREPMGDDTAKFKDASKLHNVKKAASTYLKKPEREHNLSKSRVSQEKCTPSNSTLECSTRTASRSPSIRRKKAKHEKQVSTLPSTVKVERQCRDDDIDIQNDPRCEDKHEVTVIKITSQEQLPADEVERSSLNLDNGKNSESCLCDTTKLIIHDKSDIKSVGDANYSISYISTEKKICKMSDTTRDLLLGNSTFLNQAEELCYFNAYQPIVPQTTNLPDEGVADTRLLLDCAKELLEHKSLQCTLAASPLTHITLKRSKLFISLEQLVGDICEGIEDLRSYQKLSGGTLAVDNLYMVLQKDIWSKGVVSGAWDLGWRYGFSLDEVEQVVVDIEQTVFSGIIEDILTDFAG